MDDGVIVEQAAAGELLAAPRHPRSRELVEATRELSLAGNAGGPLEARQAKANPVSPNASPARRTRTWANEAAHALLRSVSRLFPTRFPPDDGADTLSTESLPAGSTPNMAEVAGTGSATLLPKAGRRASGMQFLASRLLHGLALLVAVSFFSFVLAQIAGGDFYSELRNDPRTSPATIARLRHQAGLDRSLPVRYGLWVRSSLRGDFGYSLSYGSPVAPLLWERTRATLLLTGTATLLAWLLAVPLGVWSASHRGTWRGAVSRFFLAIWLTVPDLLLALALLALAAQTGWFPVGGRHLALPAAVLVLGLAPALIRHVCASLLEAMDSPFALSARAQGIPRRRRLYRHLLPAALNPLFSLFGFSVGTLLSASLLVEVVTGWPGLGPLFLEAIDTRDFAIVLAVVMLSAVFLLAGNLLADLLLYRFDPRIRTVDR
jgi:peptide/nickel transport system permease protein